MASLLDIAPTTTCEAVRINGGTRLVVRGLGAPALASIAVRYPKIVAIFLGGGPINLEAQFIGQFGNALAPIIAAGCGNCEDEEAERRATNLLVEDQIKLFNAIWRLTFPNGWNAFVKVLTDLTGAGEQAKVYKVRLKKSPSPLPPSSDAASRPNMQ